MNVTSASTSAKRIRQQSLLSFQMAQSKSLVAAIEDATDKNQLTEDWARVASVCEIVSKNPSENGRQAVDILVNQLVDSPNGNVQRYTLTVLNAIVQESGLSIMYHRPEFTWGELQRLGMSPHTHATVRERLLDILEDWKHLNTDTSFKEGPDCTYKAILQAHPYLRPQKTNSSAKPSQSAPIEDDEDEDLKRALALSLEESQRNANNAQNVLQSQGVQQIRHVKALYDLNATGPGELSFRSGDIIEVLDDKMHKDWWKGRLHNNEGIFPTNYVEPCSVSVPSAPAIVSDEEYIFAQSRNVEKLLSIFATASRYPDMNVINNPDVQRMYNELMAMHPRIIQLIAEYQTKKADLMIVNDQIGAVRQKYQEMFEQGEKAVIADQAEAQRQSEARRLVEMQKQYQEQQKEAARIQQQLEAEYRARLQAAPETLSLPYNVNGHMTHPLAAQFPTAQSQYGYQVPPISSQASPSGQTPANYAPRTNIPPQSVPSVPQTSSPSMPTVPAVLNPVTSVSPGPPAPSPLPSVPPVPSVPPPVPSAYPYQSYQAYPQ